MRDKSQLRDRYPPYLIEAGKRIGRDAERLARTIELARPPWFDRRIADALNGTFGGNALLVIRSTLVNDCIQTLDRLFEQPFGRRQPDGQVLSIPFVLTQLSEDRTLRRLFRCDQFRWGTRGYYTIARDGVTREMTFAESFDLRRKDGLAQSRDAMEALASIKADVDAFVASEEYLSVRVYRVERLAHSIMKAHDRRRFGEALDVGQRPIEEAMQIFERALSLASQAMLGAFHHSLSLDDARLIWRGYAEEFWGLISKSGTTAQDIWDGLDQDPLNQVPDP